MSLIDALVALAILAFAVLGVWVLNLTTLENNHLGRRLGDAVHLAQAKLEELRAADYASVVSGSDGPLSVDGSPSGEGAVYTRSWTVVADAPANGIKHVTVDVAWPGARGAAGVALQTFAIDG